VLLASHFRFSTLKEWLFRNFYGTMIGDPELFLGYFGFVFKLDRNLQLTDLYSLCPGSPGYCPTVFPYGALVQDRQGNLYGTANFSYPFGYGGVFKLMFVGPNAVE